MRLSSYLLPSKHDSDDFKTHDYMPLFQHLPIMPKEIRPSLSHRHTVASEPYISSTSSGQRNAAIWSSSDDEVLLQARASGLNWQPIATRYFPSKTANACRKRHERLVERRHVEEWDSSKLELLAQEYLNCRREMWEILASRLGERWVVVEAKCMEKGLKTLQSTLRTAQRKASAASHSQYSMDERGNHSDSGIGLGSDAEMDVVEDDTPVTDMASSNKSSSSWHARTDSRLQNDLVASDHIRSRSLPQPLPLYQPPPPITRNDITHESHHYNSALFPMHGPNDSQMYAHRQSISYPSAYQPSARHSPTNSNASSIRDGISIRSVLSG